jgi:foldase protein PrsA
MKKLLSLVVLGGMLLAACGGGPGSGAVAATVDGTEVTVGDVNSLIDAEGTVPVDQFAQYLAFAIQWNILFTAAEEDYGITISDEEAEEEATRLVDQLASGDESREDFLATRGVTERFLMLIAEQSLIDTRIREELVAGAEQPTAEELEQARSDALLSQTEACVSHILVETEEEAQDVLDRLESGEEFADVATAVSTDTASAESGGDLGCSSPDRYVPEFRDAVLEAPVGEVNPDAVQSQFGYHVILVTGLTEPATEDLPTEEDLASTVIENAVVADVEQWFYDSMEAAEVTVEDEYGTWSPVPPTVTPPSTGTTGAGTGSTTTTVSGE